MGKFDGLVDETLAERGVRTSASLTSAIDVQPDQAAAALAQSKRFGIPAAALGGRPDPDLGARATLEDNSAVIAKSPTLGSWLASNPTAMQIAQDDLPGLSAVDETVRVFTRGTRALAAGAYARLPEGLYGAGQAITEPLATADTDNLLLSPTGQLIQPLAAQLSRFFTWGRKGSAAEATRIEGDQSGAGTVEQAVYSGLQSVGVNIGPLALSVMTGNPTPALATMATVTGGSSYGRARDAGLEPVAALPYAINDTAIEYVTERIPLVSLLGELKAGSPFYRILADQMVKEGLTEQAATFLQDANAWAALNPEKTAAEFLAERPNAALQTAIATAVATGLQTGAVAGVQRIAQRREQKLAAAEDAQSRLTETLTELNTLAEASKVRERDVDTFESFVTEATKDGPVQDVFISADALAQSGVLDQVAALSPSVAQQFATAQATGGMVRIPLAEVVGRLGGETAAPLLDHLKTDPNGFSKAEADEYVKEHAEALKADVERELNRQGLDDEFNASRERVASGILAQLQSVNRFTEDVNKPYAAMVAARYATLAQQMGMTPEQVAQQYPLRIVGESVTGLDQGGLDNGAVSLRALSDVGHNQAVVAQSLIDRMGMSPEQLADILESISSGSEGNGILGGPARSGVLAEMRAAALHNPKILDAIIGSVPIDVVNNLAGSQSAAHVLFHNEAMNENSPAFNADLVIAENVDAANPVLLLVREAAGSTAETIRGSLDSRLESAELGTASDARKRDSFSQNEKSPRAKFDPETRTIALLKAADLTSFLHEAGHFFLELQAEVASQPNAPAAVREDMDRILNWFGIKETPERSALDVWRSMTLNEQREHHEKFARGFEAYLFEGKAPNVAMRGVFQRFRSWLLNVYRDLKNLNVTLNDEIRGVFDRMLASEQEIADAEAGRSMGMLFESAEEAAKFGVDWRAYHDQGLAATDKAVEELQAKSLGDMRWLTGARARLLKKMQREAERERREVRATVRGEVLAQPVYRAWTFLSGKSDAPVKKRNVDVDPEKDSLFEAIRKLGGINKDEVVSTWGTDPADLASENRVRTRQPLAPAKAGMTIDGMAEVLSEFGYLGTDEHGKWDLAQFEEKFDQELRGTKQWSFGVNPEIALGIFQETVNIDGLARGKLDTDELRETYGAGENAVWRKLVDMGMTSAKRGLPADGLAEQMGFTSGDEMITALVSAQDPATVIEAETDKRMLELHGDTYTPEGMALAVDEALHNAARTRMTATELSALEKAGNPRTPAGTDSRGRPRTQATLPAAAKAFAEQLIAKLTPRTLLPAQYAASAERARKAAAKALKAGNVAEAALEKRNQLVNEYAAKAAHDARDELTRGLDYLKGFAKTSAAKRVDADYLDQIHAILEKFDLRRAVTLKEIDKRKSLADWIAEQEELGIEPELPPHVRADALRVSYKELSLEQFRGVVDSVRQIEHLGKLKKKLLLARDARELEQVLAELKVSIADNAPASEVENRTRNTAANRAVRLFTAFVASHRKVASLARQLDGFKDGGPMWEHFIRNMNERGDFEATRRAAATKALAALLAPVSKAGRMSGKGIFIKELGLSLNREERITVALNVGNAGNMQRLMDGRGWSQAGVSAVLDTLTKEEWDFVQGVWDHFETYRPEIAAKQRRVFGFEPEWVEPQPVLTKFGQLRGGYYPIVYDARESLAAESNEEAEQAQRQLKGAKVAATTRRTFTKNRAEAVKGRPLLLTMDGMFRGVNDVIHDLAWHEWIIDSNRILRGIDPTVRAKYGADVVRQFKDAVRDIAAGEQSDGNALNRVIGPLRTGASVAGLGFNLVNVALQGLGITQTIVRIGPKWTAKGVAAWVTSPRKLVGDVFERSEFMRNRARTLNREINELQSVVRDKNKAKARLDQVMFWPMQMFQMGVDMPTWWGAYQKALAEDTDDSRAVALADQAVIDAQGSGQVKDLAGIQRGPEALKLFTVFYGFFSTTYNLAVERGKATKMTSPLQVARLAVDYLVLFSVPAVLGELLRQALAGGDDDEEKLAEKLAAAQVSYLMGTMVGVREASGAVQSALGIRQYAGGYGGPAGLRFLQELDKLGQQVGQGEFDRALVRTAVNVAGVTLHLPSAQINRTLDGVIALEEGKTDSPMALIGGVPAAQR